MATQTTNRISFDVKEGMIAIARQLLTKMNEIFPFLIGLTPEERQTMPKMDVANNIFVTDALTAARNNKNILPPYFNLKELERDKVGYDALDELVVLTSQLAQKFKDTQMLMGSEAYVSALTIYRLFESAARDGVPGADAVYAQLYERFKGQGVKKSPTPEITNSETKTE